MAQGQPLWAPILTVLQGELGQISQTSQGIHTKRGKAPGARRTPLIPKAHDS